jgi:hypothetical protein
MAILAMKQSESIKKKKKKKKKSCPEAICRTASKKKSTAFAMNGNR